MFSVQSAAAIRQLHEWIPGAPAIPATEQTLLGAPVTERASELVLTQKETELTRLIERLHYLDNKNGVKLITHW